MKTDTYDDEAELWKYIGRWYNRFFTDDERFGPTVLRLKQRFPDAPLADIKAVLSGHHGGKSESRPVVRELQAEVDESTRRAIDRICHQYADILFINRCPKCRRIVASPAAKQCLWCGNDWHAKDGPSGMKRGAI